ncbi:uncharacterized protein LOC110974573 isoform X2 [Acanthaster planci]|uniref:Uncharacterized protein LOC110974573 isoform X2 n=1 Tax=Acanthaster planci TaxID=133434 RepID=A0A8B7XPN2_ACAPL|nr:uncharacterized protein LOC110974573 isoform X2 [Acanthaster planci]
MNDNNIESDAEVYLKHDWNTFISCCKVLYPNQTCHVACPCRNGASCNPINRSCICKPGWVGSNCQTSCREKNNSTYGPSCKRGCRCGLDAACEPITGVCECINPDNCTARCPINRYGPKCRQKCRCKTGGCDHITGVCTVADTSQRSCGCLNRGTCRLHGKPCRCPAAWTGQLCDEPCPPGYYGDDCSIQCECGENATCSRSTGLCRCATEDRYSCLGRCPQGLFGPRCSNQCSCPVGLVCNHWTGDCECAAGDCQDLLLGNTTDVSTATVTIPRTTQLEPLKTITITAGTTFPRPPSPTPPSSGTLLHHTIQKTTVNIPTTARSMTRAAAKKHSVKPAPASGTDAATDGSPQRSDDEAVAGGNEFYPTAPFWGVVGAIAALLLVVVVLLLLILRRQVSSPRSALTRQPKIYRQDNVYETVDELSKGAPTEQEVTKTPPALPDMFQRGGSIRSSVHNYHRRPLSVHSPLPAMDAPLPASVAAMVCNYGSAPPLPGGTSRRSLMAEWRPNGKQESAAEKAKSRPHSNVVDEPQTVDRSGKSLSCIYHGGVTIEDDYADPFDSIAPTGNTGNRPPGYLPMILGKDERRSQSPVQQNRPVSPAGLQRCSSPMTVQRSDSPMTVQRCESPMSVQRERCESPMSVQRCESPMSVQRSSSLMNIPRTGSPLTVNHSEPNLNLYQTDSNMNIPSRNSPVALRKEANGSSSTSLQRQSATPNIDPFYFTLEQQVNLDSPKIPDDDYDELEPQSLINSPAGGLPINNRSTSRTSSERSRVSSQASSRGSLSAASPTLASPFGFSPRDAEMFAVLDRRPETTRPDLAQRPLSSNAYEPCGPPTKSVSPPDDGVYSRLSRAPSQKIELPKCPRGVADLDTNPYGRLQRSYSAKNFTRNPDTYDGPYGKLPQRSRSAMVKSQQVSGSTAECVASEWVPAEPHPRLPPRGTKPPNVTEPRKKFRWSLKGKLSKKSSPEEVDYDCPTSTATLPYPGDWKGL